MPTPRNHENTTLDLSRYIEKRNAFQQHSVFASEAINQLELGHFTRFHATGGANARIRKFDVQLGPIYSNTDLLEFSSCSSYFSQSLESPLRNSYNMPWVIQTSVIRIPQLFEHVLIFPSRNNLTYSNFFKFCF